MEFRPGLCRAERILGGKHMKITICIGSSCHLKGSRQIVEGLQALVKEHGLEDKMEQSVHIAWADCQNGVCLTVDDQKFSLKPEDVQTFFEKEILPKV